MKRYRWKVTNKKTREKLDEGLAWASDTKDLLDSYVDPVVKAFYLTADDVRVSVKLLDR